MTGASRCAGSSACRTDCTMRPVTTTTSGSPRPAPGRSASSVRGLQHRRPSTRACGRSRSRRRERRAGSPQEARASAVRVAAGRLHDVGGDVGDLLRGQLALERRHRPGARRSRAGRPSTAAASPGRGSGRPCRVVFASASVWQPTQPALRKTALPAVGSPSLYCGGITTTVALGTVPTTLVGSGSTTFPPAWRSSSRRRRRG